MSDVLLVDFGASRIKCALWSKNRQLCVEVNEIAAPLPVFGKNGEIEVLPEDYWTALEATAGQLITRYKNISALWLCTEMHGVIVADDSGVPITPYISWRDSRAKIMDDSGKSTFDRLYIYDDNFFSLSGIRLRPGLPIVSLAHLISRKILPEKIRLFTLADWLLWRGGERDPAIHASLAAGTGFYDINTQKWSAELFDIAGLRENLVGMPRVVPVGSELGQIHIGGRELPVFGGIGDLQAAIYGAGFPLKSKMAVNLGTGSQVVRVCHPLPGIERRPGLNGNDFAAITHIPSGRALTVYSTFMDCCSQLGGGQPIFWKKFAQLTVSQVLSARLIVDLNVFDAAWHYSDGGSVGRIHEDSFNADELIASIAKGWLSQYVSAIGQLDPEEEEDSFIVSGGLSRRSDFVISVLAALSGRNVVISPTLTGEETLDGLLGLASITYGD